MYIQGFVPYWLDYNPEGAGKPARGLRKLSGRYLLNYSLDLLDQSELIQGTSIFSSDPKVLEYIEPSLNCQFIKRPKFLDNAGVSIEQIISEFLKNSDAEIIVLLHPNSPFLQLSTLNDCISAIRSGRHDSAFTAYQFRKLAWFKGCPLNYSLNKATPAIDQIEPVIIEQSSLYVFSRKVFLEKNSRIGNKPFIKFINRFEGHEVNDTKDLEMAELIVNSGMFSQV